MASFETLVDDVYKLLDGHDLTTTVASFSDKLGAALVSRFKEHGDDREPTLRMSNIGKPLRQLWYELKNAPKEKLSQQVKFKFLYGDLLELLFLFLAKEAGHTVEYEQHSINVDGVPGHIDGIIDGVLIDLKSCSPHSFNKFKSGKLLEDDPFGYIGQLSGYKEALGIERAAFIAIDKVHGDICIYELPATERQYNVRDRIKEVRKAVDSDIEPARCYEPKPVSKTDKTGNLVLDVGCSYCSHKFHCWRDANGGEGLAVRFYSTGPKFFVHIEKEPRLKSASEYEAFPIKEEE